MTFGSSPEGEEGEFSKQTKSQGKGPQTGVCLACWGQAKEAILAWGAGRALGSVVGSKVGAVGGGEIV